MLGSRGNQPRRVRFSSSRYGSDDLARVHPVARVEDGLELAERPDQLGTEHPRQQLAPRLAVAVLAGQRAAVGDHQVGRVLHERAVGGDALRGAQLERDPGVHAALPEVPVQRRALVVVALQQLAEVPQVVAEPLGRDRGVLPAFVRLVLARRVGGRAQARLAHVPQPVLDRRVIG